MGDEFKDLLSDPGEAAKAIVGAAVTAALVAAAIAIVMFGS